MSKAKKVHEKKEKYVENGNVVIKEEYLIDGDKGLLIKYYHKEGDKKDKYVIIKKDGDFIVKESHGETKEPERTVSKKDLMTELKKIPDLKFALEYLKELKGGKRRSRKSSKGSKKSSKKRSKKRSRGGSRKSSKRSRRRSR